MYRGLAEHFYECHRSKASSDNRCGAGCWVNLTKHFVVTKLFSFFLIIIQYLYF